MGNLTLLSLYMGGDCVCVCVVCVCVVCVCVCVGIDGDEFVVKKQARVTIDRIVTLCYSYHGVIILSIGNIALFLFCVGSLCFILYFLFVLS